ncbi:MAG TPA: histidine phosphatase family protein [Steroidobacteraceae bacterium]|jgi:broad specificity phosphatase PhoE|nr:histidine phosphatase family protein [Steroidobacteraceae bacterium]
MSAKGDVYLVRHGETAWSITGQHTGRTDLALTPRGEGDARALGPRLHSLKFDHVLASPLLRAMQTFELTGCPGPAAVDPELVEWDYGDYEGRTLAQIHQGRPEWELFRDGCPGGESVLQITARADRVLSRIRALSGNVIVFSSGHMLRVLASRWVGNPAALGRHLVLDPTSVSVLGYDHGGLDSVIRLWNDR